MFNKMEYKLSANTIAILIEQVLIDGKLCDTEKPELRKSGIISLDVKSGISMQFKRPKIVGFRSEPFNVTGPVVSVRKDGNKIFVESKGSGVSTNIIHRVQIKHSVDDEFKKYTNF